MRSRSILLGLCVVLAMLLVAFFPASTLATKSRHPEPSIRNQESNPQNPSTVGTDILLSTRLGTDVGHSVAYSPAGQFLVVWGCSETAPGGYNAVCGQFYDEQGEPQGGNMILSFPANGAVAAYSPACGCYMVVWTANEEIRGLLLGSDGSVIVDDLPIYDGAVSDQFESPITVASNGTDFYVVWEAGEGDVSSVYGRQVNAGGDIPYPAQLIAGGDGTTRDYPVVAYNPFAVPGEYLVVMRRGPHDEAAQITARRVRADSSLPGAEYAVATRRYANSPVLAAAPWDAGGAWVVVWEDSRNAGSSDVFGRVVLAGSDAAFDDVDFSIAAVAGSDQGSPAIARSPTSGQFLVAYVDDRNTIAYAYDIYAQRLDADAAPLGPEIVVSEAPDAQLGPKIAAGEDPDVYFVAWGDLRTRKYDIYGQRIAWNGMPLLSDFAISAQPDYQVGARVAYDPQHDQYLAVWSDYASGQRDVYGQRLSSDGLPLEAPWAIEADGHENAYPDVAYSSDADCFVAVWDDFEQNAMEGRRIPPAGDATVLFSLPGTAGGGGPNLVYDAGSTSFLVAWSSYSDLWAHALNQDGTPLAGDNILLAGSPDSEAYPAMAADSANHRYLVVWQLDTGDPVVLYGRLVGPYGNLIGDPFPVAGGDGLLRRGAAVAFKPPSRSAGQAVEEAAGEYLVVYERDDGTGSSTDLYGQRLDLQGATIGGEFLIYDGPAGVSQGSPAVTYSPEAGRYFVVWGEDRNDGNAYDLYSRWLAADGSPVTAVLPFSRHPGDQVVASLAYDYETQRVLATWWDYRTGDCDIHAQLAAVDATPPTAAFTRDPIVGKEGDTFTLNAWPSSDDSTPRVALSVRWDWTSNGSWDTPWSLDKYVEQTISTAGTYTVTLQVRDLMSQTGTIALPIYVQPANPNTPPVAALTISPLVGQVGANMTFDASGCSDAETPSGSLFVRWDWENDGAWDTSWSITKIATHAASTTAGFYVARVEVRDGGNLTDAALRAYLVVPGAAVVLEVSPPLVALVPGTEFQFRAEARDVYGNAMGNPPVTWSVADPAAGAIGDTGLFTAGVEAGLYPGVVVATWDALDDQAGVIIAYPYRFHLPVVMK